MTDKPIDVSDALKPQKGKAGRPRYQRDEKFATTVEALCAEGVTLGTIARSHGMGSETFAKLYREEIDRGTAQAVGKVESTLFRKALGGDTACICFYLKCRSKGEWLERQKIDLSNDDGSLAPATKIDLGGKTMDEIREIARLAHDTKD